MQASVQWLTEDCAPMIAHQLDALEKWGPGSQEPNETAVTYAYGGKDFYDFIQSDPVRERRFGTTITQVAQQPRSSLKFIQSGFDWDSLGTATVVDVGGHTGSCAVAIAEAAPKLHVIVQDRPDVVAMAQEPKTNVVPAELQGRVSFQAHDFYTPQPTPADVYFFRKTLLNHTDRWAGKVVQALSPVLKEGNRLLIMDFVQSDGPVQTTPIERFTRAVDLQMLLYYNSRYRTLDEWKALVAATEPRLEFETVCTPPGSGLAIISFIVRSDSMANGSLDNGSVNNGSVNNGSLANRDSEAKETLDNASLENGASTVNGSSTVNGASTDNKDSMANGSSTDNKDPMGPGSLMENGSSTDNGSSVATGSSMDNGSSMPNGSPKANESSKAVESPMANGTSTDEKTSMDNGSPLADGPSMAHASSTTHGGLANGSSVDSGSS
jgi:precorrin-6B methylase 2